ncbi:MAG: TetR/AcrR family transcriptional regulator, partial [Nannocystaceae bacterium]
MERTHPSPAIKPVSQQRSQRTLQRIIDAFAMLLHTKTFEEITVAEICRAAGCSVGSFYGRVASKDDLLGHLC